MKPRVLSTLAIAIMGMAGFAFTFFSPTVFAVTTTVTGWLVPDASHFSAGIPIFLFAIIITGLFAFIGRAIGMERHIATMALIGLFVGSLLGVLSLGNASSGNFTPFALPIISGVDLLLYLWLGA